MPVFATPVHTRQRGRASRVLAAHALGMAWAVVTLLSGCASGPARSPQRDGPPPQSASTPAGASTAPTRAELASQPDPVPQVEPIRPGGPNKPYTVLGQSYEPMAEDVPWSERGAASWYGQKFHGRRTASGEVYSMYGLTAAHRTLPIPSYLRVRNVRNGKDIIVRVNDRGPFHAKRILDLSYAAAVKLDIAASGIGEVEISRLTFDEIRAGAWQRGTVLDPDPAVAGTVPMNKPDAEPVFAAAAASAPVPLPEPVPAPVAPDARAYTPAAKGFWVQLASLARRDGVERLQQRIGQQLDGLLPMLTVFHEPPLFKLQVGPYASRAEAQQAAAQARRTLQLDPMVLERR